MVDARDRIRLITLPRGFNEERLKPLEGNEDTSVDSFAGWASVQLERYFLPQPDSAPADLAPFLADIPSTPFQARIRKACLEIPRGSVVTYGELAAMAGFEKSTHGRAVGQCMAKNPFPLVVPCHRVLSDGLRIGHYGGGAGMKRHLLECEGAARLARQ